MASQAYNRYMHHIVIDPRKSNFIGPWDLLTALALIFTTFVTPYEVALLGAEPGMELFFTNRCVDLIFLSDLFLQFGARVPWPRASAARHARLQP